MQLEIYDKPEGQSKSAKPDDYPPTSLEEQISKGRQFVWKHSDKVKVIARFSLFNFNSCFPTFN
jgi:hypothetical protein